MIKYEKPVVLANEDLSEGVYAASGSDCFVVTAYIHQRPQLGRGDYRIQMNATHDSSSASHHGTEQILTVIFNLPVTYVSSNGSLISGDGTTTIKIRYNYHVNAGPEGVGLGDLVVQAEQGLEVVSTDLYCNRTCEHNN